jgi:YfiR/HmsC-like
VPLNSSPSALLQTPAFLGNPEEAKLVVSRSSDVHKPLICPVDTRRYRDGHMAILTRARKGWFPAALAMVALLGLLPGMPLTEPASKYQVKAAFLLNFTRFVEWPAAAFANRNAPFQICILGEDPFGDALDRVIEGESAGSRKLKVRRIQQPPSPKTCQVLFVSRAEKNVQQVVNGLGPGVLTVGETDGFLQAGGMIAFVLEENRVRFDINYRAAVKASLTLSARLLGVARSVQK